MSKDVIVALDFDSVDRVVEFLSKFDSSVYVKVGMELFFAEHVEIFRVIRSMGHKIFFDIKCHDIATTVGKAMRVISRFDVDMVNVHALGGLEMLKEARSNLRSDIKLIAVTQLTSHDVGILNDELQISGDVKSSVLHLAKLAKSAGLDGVVCSCHEVGEIHDCLGLDFMCVTPGIRRFGADVNEQKRVMTPSDAGVCGSDFIVVGRDITCGDDPVGSYNDIRRSFLDES